MDFEACGVVYEQSDTCCAAGGELVGEYAEGESKGVDAYAEGDGEVVDDDWGVFGRHIF